MQFTSCRIVAIVLNPEPFGKLRQNVDNFVVQLSESKALRETAGV